MILSEQEKNRIRGIHKNHSTIKEQMFPTDTEGNVPPEAYGPENSDEVKHDDLMNVIEEWCADRNYTGVPVGDGEYASDIKDLMFTVERYCVGINPTTPGI
tara:strand:+ start:128 stop:430 length:303 start_codon:yes stop_codon:yes gene_type:complete